MRQDYWLKYLARKQAKNDEIQSGCRKDQESRAEPPQDPRHTHASQNLSASAIPAARIPLTPPPSKTDAFSSFYFQDQTTCFSNLIHLNRGLRLVKLNCSQLANSAPSTEQRLPSKLILEINSRSPEKVRSVTGPATQVGKGHIPFVHSPQHLQATLRHCLKESHQSVTTPGHIRFPALHKEIPSM